MQTIILWAFSFCFVVYFIFYFIPSLSLSMTMMMIFIIIIIYIVSGEKTIVLLLPPIFELFVYTFFSSFVFNFFFFLLFNVGFLLLLLLLYNITPGNLPVCKYNSWTKGTEKKNTNNGKRNKVMLGKLILKIIMIDIKCRDFQFKVQWGKPYVGENVYLLFSWYFDLFIDFFSKLYERLFWWQILNNHKTLMWFITSKSVKNYIVNKQLHYQFEFLWPLLVTHSK